MTPKVVELVQRLANGETIYCPCHEEPILSVYIRAGRNGSLEFRNAPTLYPDYWHDGQHFSANSLISLANRAIPPEPAQPKRQVRSVDLTE